MAGIKGGTHKTSCRRFRQVLRSSQCCLSAEDPLDSVVSGFPRRLRSGWVFDFTGPCARCWHRFAFAHVLRSGFVRDLDAPLCADLSEPGASIQCSCPRHAGLSWGGSVGRMGREGKRRLRKHLAGQASRPDVDQVGFQQVLSSDEEMVEELWHALRCDRF